MNELMPFIEIGKGIATVFGPIIAVLIGVNRYKEEKLKDRRALAIDMDRGWVKISTDRKIINETFLCNLSQSPVISATKTNQIPVDIVIAEMKKQEVATAIENLMSYLETISVSVASGAADEEMAFELMNVSFVRYARLFEYYIVYKQKHDHESYCIYLQTLSKKWENKMTSYKSPFLSNLQ